MDVEVVVARQRELGEVRDECAAKRAQADEAAIPLENPAANSGP